MKPIKRADAEEPLASNKLSDLDLKTDMLMHKVMNDVGLSGFSPNGPLKEFSNITRVVFVNKIRQEYLEDFFSNNQSVHIRNRYLDQNIDIFDTKCLTQSEKDFIMFNLDKRDSIEDFVETKLYLKANFNRIRTTEELEDLILEDLGVA